MICQQSRSRWPVAAAYLDLPKHGGQGVVLALLVQQDLPQAAEERRRLLLPLVQLPPELGPLLGQRRDGALQQLGRLPPLTLQPGGPQRRSEARSGLPPVPVPGHHTPVCGPPVPAPPSPGHPVPVTGPLVPALLEI